MTERTNIMITGEHISEVYRWYEEGMLIVNRRYQRKLVWTLQEKRKFINTILDEYPVPLFLLVSKKETINDKVIENKEILDGLQRLEAIFSFILNKYAIKYEGKYQYFNLEVYPGNGILIREGKLKQKTPVMDAEICRKFMQYLLPISLIDASTTVVDDVFTRINSTGRKLSPQDLRQAGITSKFSNLVRIIATHLRGDATDSDLINMNEIADYSLSNKGLDYGIDIRKVFWVEQGIIGEDGIRRSKDEEIIAILCSCLLSNYKSGMSLDALSKLYSVDSNVYTKNEEMLTPDRFDDIVDLFRNIFSDLEKILDLKGATFEDLLYTGDKKYNKDVVFIIVFLALAQLYTENYQIADYTAMANEFEDIAARELSEIASTSDCRWNIDVRNRLVERLKNVFRKHMKFREHSPELNREFIRLLKQASTEKQMYEFKIGFHDLRNGTENESVISKCVKTLIAMANTNPGKDGIIVIGISDKDSDVEDFRRHYNVMPLKYNEYYVPGVNQEAVKYYGSIQRYMEFIKNSIQKEKDKVASTVIHNILTTIDTLKYDEQTLVVLRLSTNVPLFYDKELYVRYDSSNKLIENGSDEFYEVFSKFQANSDTGVQQMKLF